MVPCDGINSLQTAAEGIKNNGILAAVRFIRVIVFGSLPCGANQKL